ncbi:MAG TPA: phosphoenolpyruvate--protein phosphotransferase [Myxococcota bacterium]|nr:phosphoenolpyruvate--protein phosphotransferase [Myxococcota bacterium]
MTLLSDVADLVSRSHDLDETLGNVVDLVAKRLDADVCSVYLTDSDLRHLTLRATKGLSRDAVGRVRLAFGEGLVGLAAQNRETVAIDRAQEHPGFRYFPETQEERFQSLMAAPLVVRDVTTGVLVVQTVEPRHFEREDVELLRTCAQLIAPVVMNAQLLYFVAQTEHEQERVVQELARSGLPMSGRVRPRAERNVELKGIATSRGIAIGPVHFLEDPLNLAHVSYTPNEDPAQEKRDLVAAVVEARRELDEIREEVGERFGAEFSAVFNTHIQILEDHGFVARLDEQVAASGNGLTALRSVLDAYRQLFEGIEDPFFRERGSDVEDVVRRVMAKLLGVRHHNVPLSDGAVVVAENILPAHFALLETEKIGALVSEHGGPTSHGAIFARNLEIPAVTGVPGIVAAARPGELAIVDGGTGQVFLSPDDVLRAEYERAKQRFAIAVEHLDALRGRRAETRDGRRVLLTANVGLVSDLRLVERHGAEGIGLFRTELLALAHRGFPSEDEQAQLYDKVAGALAPQPVTIRTLDLGGEKTLPNIGLGEEENPQLGLRSVRLTLFHEKAFRAQLRAILRASAHRNVRLLIPMISCVGELRRVRKLLEESQRELAERGVEFDPELQIGIMIEVPAAALTSDTLARECDFFSIGTNDLTQYTLAVDRNNERVAELYEPLHPAVLALIDRTVRAGSRHGLPVSVCGEMASHPLAVPILVGLGIDELSVTPGTVPVVKEIVRALDSSEVAADAREALRVGSAEAVRCIAAARLRASGLLDHPDIGSWLRTNLESRTTA